MNVEINGEARSVPNGLNVRTLLDHLDVVGERVAVEINLDIIPRATWTDRDIADGDTIEIVAFVGGG